MHQFGSKFLLNLRAPRNTIETELRVRARVRLYARQGEIFCAESTHASTTLSGAATK
jgi:hypothetical protein